MNTDFTFQSTTSFNDLLDGISKKKKSRLVFALDLAYEGTRNDSDLLASARQLIEETSDYICGIKINFHLLLPLSLEQLHGLNVVAHDHDLVSIADMKLNDIDNTNLVASRYLWRTGFSAVIVNPFVGLAGGLDSLLMEAREMKRGVIALVYMSHKAADEAYGLKLENGKSMYEVFVERANSWRVQGVVVGATRPEVIRKVRSELSKEIKIFSPGSGAQGGNPIESLKAGADYLILGRSIVESKEPAKSAKQILDSIADSAETR